MVDLESSISISSSIGIGCSCSISSLVRSGLGISWVINGSMASCLSISSSICCQTSICGSTWFSCSLSLSSLMICGCDIRASRGFAISLGTCSIVSSSAHTPLDLSLSSSWGVCGSILWDSLISRSLSNCSGIVADICRSSSIFSSGNIWLQEGLRQVTLVLGG